MVPLQSDMRKIFFRVEGRRALRKPLDSAIHHYSESFTTTTRGREFLRKNIKIGETVLACSLEAHKVG